VLNFNCCNFTRQKSKSYLAPSNHFTFIQSFRSLEFNMVAYVGTSKTTLQWVNHDAQNMKAAPNRGDVFRHIQNSYRKWKRQQDNKSLAASAKLPVTTGSVALANDGTRVCRSRRHHDALPTTLSLKDSTDSSYPSNFCDAIIRRPSAPLTILQHGNSDPFGVFAIEITPRVNAMLSFYRDSMLTAMCHVDVPNGFTKDAAVTTWQTQVESLEDPGHR
jgi:hypothetical protein